MYRVIGTHQSVNETSVHDLASIFGPVLINRPNADLMYIAESVRVLEHLMLADEDIFSVCKSEGREREWDSEQVLCTSCDLFSTRIDSFSRKVMM